MAAQYYLYRQTLVGGLVGGLLGSTSPIQAVLDERAAAGWVVHTIVYWTDTVVQILFAKGEPQAQVNVAAPSVTVEAPTVHVSAPDVNVEVAAPAVTVEAQAGAVQMGDMTLNAKLSTSAQSPRPAGSPRVFKQAPRKPKP